MTTLHVGLGAGLPSGPPAPELLDGAGPRVILGGSDPLLGPVEPSERSLFGPRGALLVEPDGPLFVADTGHHRMLGWARRPVRDDQPADWVLGQPGFHREGRNALGEASALTMNVPCGIARVGDGLAVADSWNNRVLIWDRVPTASGVPADRVLGQADFVGQDTNRGRPEAHANTMHWPFQVLEHEGRLYVADAGNRRVLVWRSLPTENGQPADFVLGQPHLDGRSDNGGHAAGPSSLRWPHDLAILNGDLLVTDAGNNRVLVWDGLPDTNDAPASRVLGQSDFEGVDHNQSSYWPDAACLNMPYAIAAGDGRLVVADTANSRLLGWRAPLESGSAAESLAGQRVFGAKGDNRWGETTRDSLCWPYGLQLIGRTAVVADTGNHRVLLWDLAEDRS